MPASPSRPELQPVTPRRVRPGRVAGGGRARVIPASPAGAPRGEGPAATPGTRNCGAAVRVLPSPQEGAGWGAGGQELGSGGPAGPPRALRSLRLTGEPGPPLYRALGWGQEALGGRAAERVPRCRELGLSARRPPALWVGWGALRARGSLLRRQGSAGRRRGGERVKRKGVEGRTRTPPLCGASSGMALLGVRRRGEPERPRGRWLVGSGSDPGSPRFCLPGPRGTPGAAPPCSPG